MLPSPKKMLAQPDLNTPVSGLAAAWGLKVETRLFQVMLAATASMRWS